jgi:hypothetical protein
MTNHPAPAIQGKILQVTPAPKEVQKTGKKGVILMQSKAGSAYGFDQASIGIMDKTKLFRDKNKVRVEAAFGDLREGQEIQVFISQPLIMSYPVQADADTLIILDPDF